MNWKIAAGAVAAVLAAAGVYAWGIGAFYPCGPLDAVLKLSDCRVVTSLPATQLQMLAVLPSGNLLTAARGDGPEPSVPYRFIEIDAAGASLSEVPLPDVPAKVSWMKAAVSPDGNRVAASSIDMPTSVFDRGTGAKVGGIEMWGSGFLGFDDSGRLLVDRGAGSFERPVSGTAQVYDAATGAPAGEVSGTAAAPIFTNGIASAMSADGTLIAQHVETRGDSGIVAVRVADSQFPSWSGQLLVAPLNGWRLGGQQLPELSFSPDGAYLAASFDAPREWGSVNSALLIWRIADRQLLARVPSWNADWEHIVWLADRLALAVTRFNLDSRASEIATISYAR